MRLERQVDQEGPCHAMPDGLYSKYQPETPKRKGNDTVKLGFQKYLAIQGKPDGKGC